MTRLCSRASVAALALSVLATLAGSAPASASTTITTGVLTNELGAPTTGTVRVYAVMPRGGTSPLLGTAKAGPSGAFTVTADDPAQLAALAKPRRGWLDWWAVADTGGHEGMAMTTSYIDDTGGVIRSVTPDAVGPRNARTARVSAAAPAPRVPVRARHRVPARIAQDGRERCKTGHEEQVVSSKPAMAVVGELNNAYNDGTSARLSYGRGGESATWFGVAVDYGDGLGFQIETEKFASFEGTTHFPTVRRRYARVLRSGFIFEKRKVRNNTCAVWDVYILTTDWQATQDTTVKQRGTLNRCVPEAFDRRGWGGGASFETARNKAVRWGQGVRVYNAGLTTRSGFDERVKVAFDFRGREAKQHYLCGPDGKQSAASAGRIFSGAIRR